jgi:hypothetical protein
MAFIGTTPVKITIGGTNASSFTQSNGIVTYNGTSLVNYAGPQIDSSGRQTNTAQPAFFAYPSADISNVTGDGTTYVIIWDAKLYDAASNFNTSTGAFTAPIAGKYQFNIVIAVDGMSGGTQFVVAGLVTSGGNTYRIKQDVFNAGTFSQYSSSGSLVVSLSASESVTVTIQVGSDTKTTSVDGLVGAVYPSSFSGFLVC